MSKGIGRSDVSHSTIDGANGYGKIFGATIIFVFDIN